ncbi:MAG: class I SAM-dependent methyltransferase [Gammaproteobacteria bacterium]|nr:class I SAM-dependent methyltransferase [Gammaproteobacteria bacterium]MDH4253974.1 class I SAM-dependent methyltransferase [Gammaproteobacteria bacterium]MDH5308885.1 class I SAM-dependent methyltransferase [Gammaproteobacteria bacterium]
MLFAFSANQEFCVGRVERSGASRSKTLGDRESNPGWQHFWRENRLAACVPDNPVSAAAIERHWTAFFSELPAGTRVLDIATGNGVLLVWAGRAARSAGRELKLTGIDLADIDPARFLPEHRDDLAAVQFIGGTAAESLPFADGSFDAVISQYGLEYADLGLALNNAARVLAQGGQLRWLAHGDDSIVVTQGRAQLADIDLLLGPEGPFNAMSIYIEARARGRKVNRATRTLTEALRAAQAHCATNPPATLVSQLCGGMLNTANQFGRYHPADVKYWLDENRKRLRGQRQRIRDLLSACLSRDRLDEVERVLGAAPWSDCKISSLNVGEAGACVGRIIHATRR